MFLSARNLKLRYLFATMLVGLVAATAVTQVKPGLGFVSLGFGPDDCTKTALSSGAVHYDCTHRQSLFFGAWSYTYTLSGQEGSPFVLIDTFDVRYIDS